MAAERLAGDPELCTELAELGVGLSHRGGGQLQLGWVISHGRPGLGRLAVVPGASRDVFTDNPTDTWQPIRDFLSQID